MDNEFRDERIRVFIYAAAGGVWGAKVNGMAVAAEKSFMMG